MRVNEDYETWNAHSQVHDQDSVWAFWRRLLALRKGNVTLVWCHVSGTVQLINDLQIYGEFEDLSKGYENVFAFIRRLGSVSYLVTLNFGREEAALSLGPKQDMSWSSFNLLIGNYGDAAVPITDDGRLVLRGWEARCYSYE